MVHVEELSEQYEINEVKTLIRNHVKFTSSSVGQKILENWEENVFSFVKVIPKDFKRMFESIEKAKQTGLNQDEAVMAAFKENMSDAARVAGN
ncbi:Ferredoxin-dependent glutamate synthase 1 [compost metagenome]